MMKFKQFSLAGRENQHNSNAWAS